MASRNRNHSVSPLDRDFFSRDCETLARDLPGCILVHETDGKRISGRIVETEAYPPGDPASHAFRGKTLRNSSMFLEGGSAYVYRIYGIHRCFNVVSGVRGSGEAVLIRALEPMEGMEDMWLKRYGEQSSGFSRNPESRKYRELCAGPGRLCKALGITVEEHDGTGLTERTGTEKLYILPGGPVPDTEISRSPRIGLSENRETAELRRWYIRNSGFLSRTVKDQAEHFVIK
jgi:DNA-3-methyladenine glycosylase